MNTSIIEGNLVFTFPENCRAVKYDDWSFFKNQFQRNCGASKAVDIVCITKSPSTLWLVEVKDYRQHRRSKSLDIVEEFSSKVRDTLAGLLAARVNANDSSEKRFADEAVRTRKIRAILHLEQPKKDSKLYRRVIEPGDIIYKLKQQLDAVDPHPRVVDKHNLPSYIIWTVQENRP
jgi:hypothetical protein